MLSYNRRRIPAENPHSPGCPEVTGFRRDAFGVLAGYRREKSYGMDVF
jgi:hypothetical protein